MLGCSFIRPMDEPTTVILLNGHSSRLPSKSVFFLPHASAVWISPKKFLPTADTAYSRNPQVVKVQKISLRNVQPQMRCFLPCSLALRLKDHCKRGDGKIARARGQRTEGKQYHPDLTG